MTHNLPHEQPGLLFAPDKVEKMRVFIIGFHHLPKPLGRPPGPLNVPCIHCLSSFTLTAWNDGSPRFLVTCAHRPRKASRVRGQTTDRQARAPFGTQRLRCRPSSTCSSRLLCPVRRRTGCWRRCHGHQHTQHFASCATIHHITCIFLSPIGSFPALCFPTVHHSPLR